MHNLNKVTANLKDEVKLYDRLQQQLSESAARNQAKSNSPGMIALILIISLNDCTDYFDFSE